MRNPAAELHSRWAGSWHPTGERAHTDGVGLVGRSSGALSAYAVYEPYGERSGDTAALPLGSQSDFTDQITGSVI